MEQRHTGWLESSVAHAIARRLLGTSWVCLAVAEFVRRRIGGVDTGIPVNQDDATFEHFSEVAGRSRLGEFAARWAVKQDAAWRQSAIVRLIRSHVARLSRSQRVNVLGWVIAVAVVVDDLIVRAAGADPKPFGWAMQIALLAVATVCLMASGPVAAACDHWRPGRPAGDPDTTR